MNTEEKIREDFKVPSAMHEVSWDTMYIMAWNGDDYDSEVLALLEDADRLSRRYQDYRFPPIIRFFSHEGKLSLVEDWD